MKRTRLHWRWVLAALVIAALAVAIVVPRSLSEPQSGGPNAAAHAEGQMVRAGDVPAEIDPRHYQIQLALAEARLAGDEAVLRNARVSP